MALIVIEGLDGSGKATQAGRLLAYAEKRGGAHKITFPDYDSPSSSLVKMYLAGALGSAILGLAAATGEKDRTALAARFVRYGEASRPDAERHAYYQKQYQLYKDLREFEVRHVKG